VAGKRVNVTVVSGTVFVRMAGAGPASGAAPIESGPRKGFVVLKGAATIPIGAQVDTEQGRVKLRSAADLKGATQTAQFYAGVFQIKQRRAARRMTTDLVVRASVSRARRLCRATGGAKGAVAQAAARGRKQTVSRLWGNGKGRFRTVTRHSAATVRGTLWLTEERCDGTLTTVRRGRVAVRDTNRRKTVLVRAGRSYLARATRAQLRQLNGR